MPPDNTVNTRVELATRMEEQMSLHYSDVAAKGKASSRQNQVKTQLVESHVGADGNRDEVIKRLNSLTDSRHTKINLYRRVRETLDEHLFVLDAETEEGPVELFVDTIDPRYWSVHSLGKSAVVRDRMEGLAAQLGKGFDTVWFSSAMLDYSALLGRRQGVRVAFTDYLSATEGRSDGDPDTLRMRLRTRGLEQFLAFLRRQSDSPFANRVAVSASIVKSFDADDDTHFVLEDIYFNGYFSARGSSAVRHLDVVEAMKRHYARFIGDLETNRAVRWEEGRPVGEVLQILFKREDIIVEALVGLLCSGRHPFNLWGFPVPLHAGHFRADVIDMHHGNAGKRLTLEITSKWLRVTLPASSCGNAVARLLSNIQRGVDSGAELVSPSGELLDV